MFLHHTYVTSFLHQKVWSQGSKLLYTRARVVSEMCETHSGLRYRSTFHGLGTTKNNITVKWFPTTSYKYLGEGPGQVTLQLSPHELDWSRLQVSTKYLFYLSLHSAVISTQHEGLWEQATQHSEYTTLFPRTPSHLLQQVPSQRIMLIYLHGINELGILRIQIWQSKAKTADLALMYCQVIQARDLVQAKITTKM